MKNFFTQLFLWFTFTLSFAQINEGDSIVRVRTFWNVNDVKNYEFTTKEIKNTGSTETKEEISCRIQIKVEDIFEDESTISWTYTKVKFNSLKFVNNPIYLIDSVKISFVMDAYGRFLRYKDLNKTILDYAHSAEKIQNKFLNDSVTLEKINALVTKYSTEENIVKIFEKDIHQYHLFFGKGDFKRDGSVEESNTYMDNLFSNSPTPAKSVFKLNEIAFTGTNYIMSCVQTADKEWLSNSWFSYLKQLSEQVGAEQPDESRLQDNITYNVTTTSRIKDNGWLSYSVETKKVHFQDTDYTLERRFELD